MGNLTRASEQLFRRSPDECCPSLAVLLQHCRWQKEQSLELWQPPKVLSTIPVDGNRLMLTASEDHVYEMTDWSFSQLCRLAGVGKDTVNRLTAETADRVFRETLPRGNNPTGRGSFTPFFG